MPAFKNVIEPAAIVLQFTISSLVNRRREQLNISAEASRNVSPDSTRSSSPELHRSTWLPDNTIFRESHVSRFLAKFPFLIEIWYWNVAQVYQLARAYSARLIHHSTYAQELAKDHAWFILRFERRLGFAIELPLQRFVLSRVPWLVPILATVYYSHIVLGVAFIVYTYTYYPQRLFTRIRRTIAMNNLIAFIVLTLWRCTPPRLMPAELGFVDVLHPHSPILVTNPASAETGSFSWSHNKFQLSIAAMPSLHFGTSLFISLCLARFSPHRLVRVLAPLWPTVMMLTILVTANHWILDAVVGALVPFLGWRWNWLFACQPFTALEEWGFWLCRTEKPFVRQNACLVGAEWLDGEQRMKDEGRMKVGWRNRCRR
ncbi:PAP2 superfamily-domain-containing protein [Clohesyomyces aquaticus]|uniref:PAP2 superfamily-domain-containing protein n=1 Tax=Clohesyomyces aquaticus TaxID=1231657 RepID=A0A1Y1ZKA4_9PLEO|nr:PAP2 superfamily-domain-containing protein [Clohesyomyces aquaticus]